MSKHPTIITATELQQKSGQILRRIFQNNEHFIVERGGYPIAAIIPIQIYQEKPKQKKVNSSDERETQTS